MPAKRTRGGRRQGIGHVPGVPVRHRIEDGAAEVAAGGLAIVAPSQGGSIQAVVVLRDDLVPLSRRVSVEVFPLDSHTHLLSGLQQGWRDDAFETPDSTYDCHAPVAWRMQMSDLELIKQRVVMPF